MSWGVKGRGGEGYCIDTGVFFHLFLTKDGWSVCLPCRLVEIMTSTTRFTIYDFSFIYYNEIMPVMSRRRGNVRVDGFCCDDFDGHFFYRYRPPTSLVLLG